MIILSVLYDEPNPATYAGIQIRTRQDPEPRVEVWNTGVPTVDFLTSQFVLTGRYGPDNAGTLTSYSSSWDHFAMDGGDLPESGYTDEQVAAARVAAVAYLEGTGEMAAIRARKAAEAGA